jgi:hypothetical protein
VAREETMTNGDTRRAELGIDYMTWTRGFPVDTARKIFERKHGARPRTWFFDGNALKVGPIPAPKWMHEVTP